MKTILIFSMLLTTQVSSAVVTGRTSSSDHLKAERCRTKCRNLARIEGWLESSLATCISNHCINFTEQDVDNTDKIQSAEVKPQPYYYQPESGASR